MTLKEILGVEVEAKDLTLLQVSVRAVIIFATTIILVRLAHKRFLSKMTALDAILGFTLASTMARAINGSAPLLETILAGLILVLLHRGLSAIAARWKSFGPLVKGQSEKVVQDGQILESVMKRHDLTQNDLMEELRQEGGVNDVSKVKEAYIERSGRVSVVLKEDA